jgi:hypothetical protein
MQPGFQEIHTKADAPGVQNEELGDSSTNDGICVPKNRIPHPVHIPNSGDFYSLIQMVIGIRICEDTGLLGAAEDEQADLRRYA